MPELTQFPSILCRSSATIQAGQSLSEPMDLHGTALVLYEVPAGFEGTIITFEASVEGVNFTPLYGSSGEEVSHDIAAGRSIRLDPAELLGVRWLKLRSSLGDAPAVQSSSRVITLVSRAL